MSKVISASHAMALIERVAKLNTMKTKKTGEIGDGVCTVKLSRWLMMSA